MRAARHPHHVSTSFQISELRVFQGPPYPTRQLAKVDPGRIASCSRCWFSAVHRLAYVASRTTPEKLAGRRHLAAAMLPDWSTALPTLEAGDQCCRAQAAAKHNRSPS